MIIADTYNNKFDFYRYYMWCPKCGYHYLADKYKTQETNIAHTLCEKCKTEYMVDIDYDIFDIIINLNKKGYETLFCCEGHCDCIEDTLPYIAFSNLSNMDALTFIDILIIIMGNLISIEVIPDEKFNIYMNHSCYHNSCDFEDAKREWLIKMRQVVDELPYIGG